MQTNKLRIGKVIAAIISVFITLQNVSAKDFEARYWFDVDTVNIKACTISTEQKSIFVSVEDLPSKPVNAINFQYKNAEGIWSPIYSQYFYRRMNKDMSLSYSLDTKEDFCGIEITNSLANVSSINDGIHSIMIFDKNKIIVPYDALFVKKSSANDNLTLLLQSARDSVKIVTPLTGQQSQILDLDISTLTPGIYPFALSLFNEPYHQTLAMEEQIVEIKPIGGNNVTNICYWLNDSIDNMRVLPLEYGKMPLELNMDIDVSDLREPTTDYILEFTNGAPFITPNFNIGLGLISNLGFMADSVSCFRDNSKTEQLKAVCLKTNEQYDFGNVKHDTILWAQFPALTGDEIRLLPRWRCSGKFYDNEGIPRDTVIFNDENKDFRFTSTADGIRYVQLYNIDESIRDFSVKMSYLKGPSAEAAGGVKNYDYEGILVDWDSPERWLSNEDGLWLRKNGIEIRVLKSESDYSPTIANKSNICRILNNNKLEFSADCYIEKITLCLPSDYPIPELKTQEGVVDVDYENNVVVWEGLSKKVCMVVSDILGSYSDESDLDSELLLEKAYVKTLEVEDGMLSIDDSNDEKDNFIYQGYNHFSIWDSGRMVGDYDLNDRTKVTFNDNSILILNGGNEYSHEINDRLIILFSQEEKNGVDANMDNSHCSVMIRESHIVISGLPDYVGIYDVAGRTVFCEYVDKDIFEYPVYSLIPGIYIIKVGDTVTKMLIK